MFLKISDLDVYEPIASANSWVNGGNDFSAQFTSDLDQSANAGYFVAYSISQTGYSFAIGGSVAGAVAGSVSSAIAAGNGYTYVYASAVARTT
ncbi:MAG TPA: hypothetical protein IGS53_04910 [Leptolyngbyaceae cyanobacterium M33_DOE_097]|uniref:Uncharacterized protein n=1 Tax=Oscillatoriales cyanobacterium SpSt-418 TaxID=2282169 RepID=A0A7C3KC94_9CYAN|nr:hypothetical protein [Leptolyngbyaceae cyanobacterium M33_DOE_097]